MTGLINLKQKIKEMKILQFILKISLSLICLIDVSAQTDNPKLDKFMLKKMKKADRIGMQAAYIADGELTWVGSYGIKTYRTLNEVNDSTVFMIASTSKPITALAMMKLYDEGKVSLDDNINKYLPFEVINPHIPDKLITIRMLLSHVSSIRDNWDVLEPSYTLGKGGGDSKVKLGVFLKEYLSKNGAKYDSSRNYYKPEPLTRERYSNVGYSLIGYLVEQISGKPFNEYMEEAIFKPLRMTNTYWFWSEIKHNNLAIPHNLPYKESDFKGTQILEFFGYPGYPSGQLKTTVSDYAQFVKLMVNEGAVDGKQFLSEKTINEFLKVQYPEISKYQAISWSYNEFENFIYNLIMSRRPSHTGLDPGMSSVVSFDPKKKTGVIIFSNSPTTTLWCEKIIYMDMVKRLFKEAEKQSK